MAVADRFLYRTHSAAGVIVWGLPLVTTHSKLCGTENVTKITLEITLAKKKKERTCSEATANADRRGVDHTKAYYRLRYHFTPSQNYLLFTLFPLPCLHKARQAREASCRWATHFPLKEEWRTIAKKQGTQKPSECYLPFKHTHTHTLSRTPSHSVLCFPLSSAALEPARAGSYARVHVVCVQFY